MEKKTPIEGWLNTSQIRMHYLDWNFPSTASQNSSDTVILALHGLASSCHWYDLVLPHLANSYRCLAFDQRGHGMTDQPDNGYDWQTVATDVVEALDKLGIEQVALMGHSWGAYVALSVAAKYPKRVSKLVLVDGGFFDWTLWPGANWEWFTNMLKPRKVAEKREEFLSGLRKQLAECWSDQLEQIVMTMVRVGPDDTVRDILEPTNHAQVLKALWNEPCTTMFPEVRCPTMIVTAAPRPGAGNSDFSRIRLEMAKAAESAIADCKVEWIADTDHDIGYHKPDELAAAVRALLSNE